MLGVHLVALLIQIKFCLESQDPESRMKQSLHGRFRETID